MLLRTRERFVNIPQVLIGCTALLAGLLLYLVNRPADTYFISFFKAAGEPRWWSPHVFTTIGGALPSFLHVFAFSMIMGGLLSCRKKGYLLVCSIWLFVNVIFELGQRHAIAASQAIPAWFGNVFILENIRNYFLKGTFDVCDLLGSLAGAATAYCILILTIQQMRE